MAFQFQLGQKHLEHEKSMGEFLHPLAGKNKEEIIKSLASEGYISLPCVDNSKAEDYLSLVLTVEQVAMLCPKSANAMVELLFAQETAKRYAPEDCQKSCVAKIANLELKINVLLSEPGNYRVDKLSTKIKKTANGYKITGTKLFAPENAGADRYLVAGKYVEGDKSKLALVGVDASKINFVTKEFAYGPHSFKTELAEIDTEVESERFITDIKEDMNAALSVWRTLISASAIGMAHNNLTSSLAVVKSIKNSKNQMLSSSQAIQFTLADMFGEIEGARLVTYYSASLIDAGKPSPRFSSIAKVQATEAAVFLSNKASGLFGNVGNVYDEAYLEALQLAYNRQIKDGSYINSQNIIYEEALARR
ncbi:MAG: acyl-CoA dehydrogenase family protein [Cyanobacteriota bacterium]